MERRGFCSGLFELHICIDEYISRGVAHITKGDVGETASLRLLWLICIGCLLRQVVRSLVEWYQRSLMGLRDVGEDEVCTTMVGEERWLRHQLGLHIIEVGK